MQFSSRCDISINDIFIFQITANNIAEVMCDANIRNCQSIQIRHSQLQQPFELNEPRCSTFLAAWWRRLTDLTFESGGASGSAGLGKPLWQRKQPVEKAAVDRDAGECGTAAEGKPAGGPSTLLGNLRLGLPPAPAAFCVGSGGRSNELVAVGSLAADAKKEGTWPARDLESVLEGGPSEL